MHPLVSVVEQRPSSSHVLVGTPFEITDSTANGSSLECSFMPGESSIDSNSDTWTTQDEGKTKKTESVQHGITRKVFEQRWLGDGNQIINSSWVEHD